ncbi:lipoprotein-releasing ABC transporter permease subunit [Thioalkalivibrio sp. XN279]|uniref:lipoprotein-releasing ABC transporter permease subunit n=1 Tax=Thioalkalivibrio sp. XN279 TaxID=2714953 RepID=UPI001408CA61|nr:lipoprotein-releasing ABC transporter permease subunit [Thioalkalivibrio sp. XN279]NHA15236.1 lipoprotein-releasing ABC transporter permease subunit [Thioalkalivibrio sp. XN279]
MFRPLEICIGLRYLRARRASRFVSFISLVSLLGVAVGVAALIVVLSVMNGFEQELRGRLLNLSAHGVVTAPGGGLEDWRGPLAQVKAMPGVTGAAPFVEVQAMLSSEGRLKGTLLRGIDPALEGAVSEVDQHLLGGSLEALQPGSDALLLGRLLAARLQVGLGDAVSLLVPAGVDGGTRLVPRMRRFTVVGLFEVGMEEQDGTLALAHLEDAAAARGRPGEVSGLRLRFADLFAAPEVTRRLAAALGPGYEARDWTGENASYFRAVRIEKTMMTLILSLVIAVAAFNIVATLVMVVGDKRAEIAILRTMGLPPGSVMRIFVVQGALIGCVGTLLGVGLGVPLAINAGSIMPALESVFGFSLLPADVYYISRLPSELRWGQVSVVTGIALVLCLLSTLYPSLRAARTEPAEALRYE